MLLKTQPRNLEDLIKNMISWQRILIQKVFLPTNFVLSDRILALPPLHLRHGVCCPAISVNFEVSPQKQLIVSLWQWRNVRTLSCKVRFWGEIAGLDSGMTRLHDWVPQTPPLPRRVTRRIVPQIRSVLHGLKSIHFRNNRCHYHIKCEFFERERFRSV